MYKKIAIGIPSGQATRDVVHSGLLDQLLSHAEVEVVLLTPAAMELREAVQDFGNRVIVEKISYYKPTALERLLRSVYWATLYDKCASIRNAMNGGRGRMLVPLVARAQRWVGAQRFLRMLDWFNRQAGDSSECRDILDRHQPDLAVLTRVFNFSADYQLLKEAAARKLPTVAVVSSWDNLTSKGFFPFGVDQILVWNEVMRQEAMELFGFPSDRIRVVGVPRFDHAFRRTHVRDRAEFLRSCGLDPQRKTITYTTANRGLLENPAVGISPELEIARYLATQVKQNAFETPAQLLVRLHPLADIADFATLEQSKHVRIHWPGKNNTFSDRLLDLREEEILANTMAHSDVVINIASTITIDAAIYDTPTICVAFDWFGKQPWTYAVERFYRQDHYSKLSETGGYWPVRSREELLSAIHCYLADPSRDRRGREAIIKQQCYFADGCASARVAEALIGARVGQVTRAAA